MELSVKGLFRHVGIEYPRSHILGRVIKRELSRMNIVETEDLRRIADISDMLALDREPSFYGTPDGTPASELYDREDASDALQKASWLIERIKTYLSA